MHVIDDGRSPFDKAGNAPWSFNKGKLLFNNVEHKAVQKKGEPTDAEITSLVTELNQKFRDGIYKPESVAISKLLTKKNIEVLPPETTTTFAKMALGVGVKQNDLHNVIALATSVVKHPNKLKKLFEVLKDMSPSDRKEFVNRTSPFLKGVKDSDKIVLLKFLKSYPIFQKALDERIEELVNTLKDLPEGEAEAILELAQPFITGHQSPSVVINILRSIKGLPQENRQKVLVAAGPYLQEFKSMHYRNMFLQLVNSMDLNTVKEGFEKAWPVVQKTRDEAEKLNILEVAANFPQKDMDKLVEDAQPLLVLSEKNKNKAEMLVEKKNILRFVGKMPPEGRKELLVVMAPLLNRIQSHDSIAQLAQRAELMKELNRFPPESRLLYLQHALPLLQHCRNGFQMLEILRTIKRLPAQEIEQIMAAAHPILDTVKTPQSIQAIIETVRGLPADEREGVVAQALSLIQEDTEDSVKAELLSVLTSFPQGRLEEMLQLVTPFLNHFTNSADRLTLLRSIIYISPESLQQGLEAVIGTMRQGSSALEIARMLQTLASRFRVDENVERDSYRIVVGREELKNNPIQMLARVAENIQAHNFKQLSVTFIGEEGIDASGLGREFMSLLSEGVITTLRPTLEKNGLIRNLAVNEENKKIYQQFGQMMMFCLNATQNYPIGMLFDRGLFIMLSKLQEHHFTKPFEELVKDDKMLRELFDIFLAIEETNEQMAEPIQRLKNWSRPFDQNTDTAVLRDLYFSESCMYEERGGLSELSEDDVKQDPSILKQGKYLAALQQVAREKIVETVTTSLKPMMPGLLELVKGMKTVQYPGKDAVNFDKAQKMGASALSETIQGQLDSKVVLERLKFGDGIPPEKEIWFREWVQSLPPDQIKRFVFALTGANAVGKADLKMFTSADRIVFHTCFSYADIPFDAITSKQQLAEVMASALSGKEKFTIG